MSTIMSSFPKSYRVSEGEIVAGGTVAETSKESKWMGMQDSDCP